MVASASVDETVKLWDVATGAALQTFMLGVSVGALSVGTDVIVTRIFFSLLLSTWKSLLLMEVA